MNVFRYHHPAFSKSGSHCSISNLAIYYIARGNIILYYGHSPGKDFAKIGQCQSWYRRIWVWHSHEILTADLFYNRGLNQGTRVKSLRKCFLSDVFYERVDIKRIVVYIFHLSKNLSALAKGRGHSCLDTSDGVGRAVLFCISFGFFVGSEADDGLLQVRWVADAATCGFDCVVHILIIFYNSIN